MVKVWQGWGASWLLGGLLGLGGSLPSLAEPVHLALQRNDETQQNLEASQKLKSSSQPGDWV